MQIASTLPRIVSDGEGSKMHSGRGIFLSKTYLTKERGFLLGIDLLQIFLLFISN